MTFLSRKSSGTLPAAISWARPFGDGGLAHAGFADEDRIVLRAAAENLDDALDFVLAADDRIEFAFLGQLGQVAAKGTAARAS